MASESAKIDFELYRYTPSLPAAIIFIILFLITTVYHCYQLLRHRSWYFIPFVLGGFFQFIGYIGRAVAHSNKDSIPIYSVQTLLILLAPPLYAASIYMVLGRTISFLQAEPLSIIPVKRMTMIFVTGDVISFLMQSAGGGIMATGTLSSMETGSNVVIAGLCVQLLFFGFFVISAALFHRRIRKSPTNKSAASYSGTNRTHKSWEAVILGLYVTSALILVRSVFRLIEYVQGNDGYLISHEVFLYVFDSVLMLFAMIVMNVIHPSNILGGSDKKRLASSGSSAETELRNRR